MEWKLWNISWIALSSPDYSPASDNIARAPGISFSISEK